jgi:hypothetical protein
VIKSIEQFVEAIRKGSSDWHPEEPKWFRGEPACNTTLTPTLYRGGPRRENESLQYFRARGAGYSDIVPHRDHTDQWLFLAQHVGLPTRLLDWSEGALIGLHFALKADDPIVWMLNPLELNDLSVTHPNKKRPREFPLPWICPEDKTQRNIAFENMAGAWEEDTRGVDLPVAIYPTYVHPRLRGQQACFTVHGKRKDGLDVMVTRKKVLQRFKVDPAHRHKMLRELALLGITDAVLFPDLDGLARALKQRFF